MPILINNTSGLAEDLPLDQATASLQQGSHEIPLVDQEGKHFTAPLGDVPDLLNQGYSRPSSDQYQDLLKHAKYSSPTEQAKTALEGAASAASLGTSTLAEKALFGAKDEDIQGRREVNPGIHGLGEVAGLAGSTLLPGSGALGLMSGAGKAAGELAIPGAGLLARAARSAIQGSIETAIAQSGDEVSKAFTGDPHQTAQSVISDMGLATLMGAGIGGAGKLVADPLWSATRGSKLGQMLGLIKSRVEGVAQQSAARDMAQQAGVELSPEIMGAMSSPEASRSASVLDSSATKAGASYRASKASDLEKINQSALEAVGKTGEESAPSAYDAGQRVKDAVHSDLSSAIDPVVDEYSSVTKGLDSHPLQGTDQLAEKLGQAAVDSGFATSPSSTEMQELGRIYKELPLQKTVGDLRNYRSQAVQNLRRAEAYHFASKVGKVMDGAIDDAVEAGLGDKAPELLERYKAVKGDYGMIKDQLGYLDEHLHVGSDSPGSFLKNLKESDPEKILNRLKGTNDAGLLQFLQERMPDAANAIRDFHLDTAISKASNMKTGGVAGNILKQVEKMSPELKDFVVSPDSQQRLEGIKDLMDQLPKNLNPSGTAGMVDALMKGMPGGVGTVLSMMTGHNPFLGYLLGKLSHVIGKEAPDYGKLAMLKFLGSDMPVSPEGYKAMYQSVSSLYRSESTLNKATKALFQSSRDILPERLVPTEKDTHTIEKALRAADTNPEHFMDATGDMGHYMADHAAAVGSTIATAATYLNGIRPKTDPKAPLDKPREPSKIETANYNRQLQLAAQPLLILQKMAEGSVLPQDLQTVRTIYPNLYQHIGQKLTQAAIEHQSKGETIPLKLANTLSQFTGMPLTSSVLPQNIMFNQQVYSPMPSPQQLPTEPSRGLKQGFKKSIEMSSTPDQSREIQKASGKS